MFSRCGGLFQSASSATPTDCVVRVVVLRQVLARPAVGHAVAVHQRERGVAGDRAGVREVVVRGHVLRTDPRDADEAGVGAQRRQARATRGGGSCPRRAAATSHPSATCRDRPPRRRALEAELVARRALPARPREAPPAAGAAGAADAFGAGAAATGASGATGGASARRRRRCGRRGGERFGEQRHLRVAPPVCGRDGGDGAERRLTLRREHARLRRRWPRPRRCRERSRSARLRLRSPAMPAAAAAATTTASSAGREALDAVNEAKSASPGAPRAPLQPAEWSAPLREH